MSGPAWGLLAQLAQRGMQPPVAQNAALASAITGYPNAGQDPFTAPPGSTPRQAPAMMPAMQQQQPGPSGLARLFGGAVPPGLLNADQQRAAGREGLLQAGLALLANSRGQGGGPAPSIGQALAAGLQAGRESYATSAQNAQTTTAMQRRENLLRTLGANTSPDQLRTLYIQSLASGDVQTANSLRGLMENERDQWDVRSDPNGGPTLLFNKRTGETRPLGTGEGRQMTPSQRNSVRDNIYTRFHSDTLKLADAAMAYNGLSTALSRLSNARGQDEASRSASALAVVYGYSKLLDPGSAVREGELALQLNNGSAPERLQSMFNRLATGELGPAYLASIRQATEDLAGAHQRGYQDYMTTYQRQARDAGFEPNEVSFPNPWARRGASTGPLRIP